MTTKERIGFVTLTLAAALVGGAVSGHIFAARAVDAAAAPKMMTAQKFMLVDAKGNTRGEFNVTSRGVAQLGIFDGTGTLRAGLGVGADGAPALGIFGHDGKPRIEVGLANSVARIVLYNPNALPQATFAVAANGQSGLDLLDKDGIPRASIVVADRRHSHAAPGRSASRTHRHGYDARRKGRSRTAWRRRQDTRLAHCQC